MTAFWEPHVDSSGQDCPDLYLILWLYVSPREMLPVQTRFHYAAADPFAISVNFSNTVGGEVTWILSRELLSEGMLRPRGEGDVRIWPPCPKHGGNRLHIQLVGRSGMALLYADITRMRSWVAGTYALIPAGTEAEAINWEASFERLLGNGTDDACGGTR